ncbi:MAG TPA: segregation/condensation protein A [Fastidiosipila sp.]|nr:segregation/condensation protein A [Fastidiosipila sp.]
MQKTVTEISARDFESPLALLSYLLEQDDIPIAELLLYPVIEQYLDLMEDLDEIDMELASEFLLMAATLLEIKSSSWLPKPGATDVDDIPDALRDLELKILAYRRCRLIAGFLQNNFALYGYSQFRVPLAPGALGIEETFIQDRLSRDKFDQAIELLAARNRARFHDLRGNVRYLLQRERVSVKVKMREILSVLKTKTKIFFSDLFTSEKSVPERIAGFLALLELMRLNAISVRQDAPFANIAIRLKKPKKGETHVDL